MAYFRIADVHWVHHSQISSVRPGMNGIAIVQLTNETCERATRLEYVELLAKLPRDHSIIKTMLTTISMKS